jgi:hypothetical protein
VKAGPDPDHGPHAGSDHAGLSGSPPQTPRNALHGSDPQRNGRLSPLDAVSHPEDTFPSHGIRMAAGPAARTAIVARTDAAQSSLTVEPAVRWGECRLVFVQISLITCHAECDTVLLMTWRYSVRSLLVDRLDRLFIPLFDGAYVTRPHGRFGSVRRVSADEKNRLANLYRYAIEGTFLLTAFSIYRVLFSDSTAYEDLFDAGASIFGATIFMAQTWLIRHAPEVSNNAYSRPGTPGPGLKIQFLSRINGIRPGATHTIIGVLSFLLSTGVLTTGLLLHDRPQWTAAGIAGVLVAGPLLGRSLIRLWRSHRTTNRR